MSTDIVRYEGSAGLDLMQLGKVLSGSGYFADAKDAAQAVVKVLAGQELGIGAIASMTGIYLVKGKVTLSANLMAAQVKRSGRYNYRIARLDDTGCEVIFFEQGQEVGRSSFTDADAKAGGLTGNETYRKFPRNMYFARAMSNGVRWYCPDIFAGPVYTPDELSGDEPAMSAPAQPARAQLPPAPPANTVTGEVVDEQPLVRGAVQAAPGSKYDAAGALHLTIKVNGFNFLIKNAPTELSFIEAGDEVEVAYHAETIKGKTYNVVDSITGPRNADGLTAWEQRESEVPAGDEEGATFEPAEQPAL